MTTELSHRSIELGIDVQGEAALLPLGAPSRQELLAAFERYLVTDIADGSASEDTITSYYSTLRHWLRWCVHERIAPGAVKEVDVKRYRAQLIDSQLKPASRQHHLTVVRRFYDAAVAADLLLVNPAKNVKSGQDPTPPEDKMRSLTERGLNALFDEVDSDTFVGKRDLLLLGLMAIHGLRRVEIHRLNHGSLLFQGRPKTAFDTDYDVLADAPYLNVHGKRDKFRQVHLRDDTYAAWMEFAKAQLAAGLSIEAESPLFISVSNHGAGGRLDRRSINRIADRYLDASGQKRVGVSCHALRHTHGTLATEGGAKLEHLRDAMGHESIDTTGIYVAAVSRKKNNPANFINPRVDKKKLTSKVEKA